MNEGSHQLHGSCSRFRVLIREFVVRIEDEYRENEELARIKERDRVLIQEARMRRAAGMSQNLFDNGGFVWQLKASH
jgi:hypothetical protein